MGNWLCGSQRRLGVVGTFAMLVFICFVTPFSLDMYTPALPQMVEFFQSDVATVNLTVLWFYVFFAIAQLIFGPLSDSAGRKPVLLGGSVVYSAGSLACFLCQDIVTLLVARIVQALGAGAIAAVGIAMAKDLFVPEKLDAALAIVTSIFGIGPIVAPLLGALLMQVAGWHAIFAALFAFGLICIALGVLLQEPLPLDRRTPKKEKRGLQVVLGLARVMRNGGFTLFMCVMAILDVVFMAYISVVSHIYVTYFGLDEIGYGIYFGVGMLVMLLGPLLWPAASKVMGKKSYTWVLLGCYAVAGILLVLFGRTSPVVFCALFALIILAESSSRPFSTAILLAQQEEDAGAAASLVNCSRTIFGAVGMALAVLPWENYIVGLGAIAIASIALSAALWAFLLKSRFDLRGVK